MKISIITVSYNSSKTIKDTIESVFNQTYEDIEYIVIDGNSNDKTLDIIKKYEPKFEGRMKWVSEPDKGIYDAMNKGINLSTGDVIGILNSDDFYNSNNIIEDIVNEFRNKDIDSVYGDLVYVNSENTNKVVRYWKSKQYKKGLFKKGWHPAHPTFFVKKEVYNKYGMFNLSYPIAADYEIMLRFLERYKIKNLYINKIFVKMRMGGESNQSIKNIIKANIECYKSWKNNELKINIFVYLQKPLSKILQYIKKYKKI